MADGSAVPKLQSDDATVVSWVTVPSVVATATLVLFCLKPFWHVSV